jgi:redox-regulated HSP33 family molecular chaperone
MLDSKLWVSSSKDTLSAMLIQKMPESKAKDSEDWHRIATLANEKILSISSLLKNKCSLQISL